MQAVSQLLGLVTPGTSHTSGLAPGPSNHTENETRHPFQAQTPDLSRPIGPELPHPLHQGVCSNTSTSETPSSQPLQTSSTPSLALSAPGVPSMRLGIGPPVWQLHADGDPACPFSVASPASTRKEKAADGSLGARHRSEHFAGRNSGHLPRRGGITLIPFYR